MQTLNRFLEAQEKDYSRALHEVRNGRKTSHWMWYIFPQLKGLGYSSMALHYGLASLPEAQAYWSHPVLGARLEEITAAALSHADKSALQIFGHPDNLKFHSCMTLFAAVPNASPVFRQALEVFFSGAEDAGTAALIGG